YQAATPTDRGGTPAAARVVPTTKPGSASAAAPAPGPASPSSTAQAGSRPIQEVMATLAPPTATSVPRAPAVIPYLPYARQPPIDLTPPATQTPVPSVAYAAPPVHNGDDKWGVGVYKESNRVADALRETQPGV